MEELAIRSIDDIAGFYLFLFERSKKLYKPELYCATFLLCEGYFSSDNFMNFVEAVSAAPFEIFGKIISEPDSIAKIDAMHQLKWDGYDYRLAAVDAYDKKLGLPENTNALLKEIKEPDFDTEKYWGPIRGCITIGNLKQWLPSLFEIYGEEAIASTSLSNE